MTLKKWEATVKVAASQGVFGETIVKVDAYNKADALLRVNTALEERKIDRWSLMKLSQVTS